MKDWRKRKRLTRLIHKHKLDKHSDYKKWVKEWCILPPYVSPSEEEWNEGMKRAEGFHRALNKEEL